MKKESAKRLNDDLRPEYDLSQLKGGVRGKYYRQAAAGPARHRHGAADKRKQPARRKPARD